MIYGGSVVIFVFGEEPKTIQINSSYLKHFELLWKMAKK